jgi:hypothetical protein
MGYTQGTRCVSVFGMTDRLVVVPEVALDDICALAERAAERIQIMTPGPDDSLVYALRGAAREIRCHSVLDPCR